MWMLLKKRRKWIILFAVCITIIIVLWNIPTGDSNNEMVWYSKDPQTLLNQNTATNDINNLHSMQNDGWKLFFQNGQPISYNKKISGRNQIMEQAATDLINGCYGITIDSKGNIVHISLNKDAEKIYNQKPEYLK